MALLAAAPRASIRGTGEDVTDADLQGTVPGTNLQFIVRGTPRRGMWVVELRGLEATAAYAAVLLWPRGKSVEVEVPPSGTDRRIQIPDPALEGSPVALVLDRVGPAASTAGDT